MIHRRNGCHPLIALLMAAACTNPPRAEEPAVDGAGEEPAGAVDAPTADAQPADAEAADANVFHLGDDLPWGEPSNGMRYLALYGESSAEGEAFVFRLKVEPGFELGPHTHPITEHLTVLSGEFWVGIGETLDREAATGYGPGSYLAIAAGVPAYMWVEEKTVVQVHGVGPLRTEFITPQDG